MSWFSDFAGTTADPWAGKFEVGPPQPLDAIGRLPQAIDNLPQDFANLENPVGLAVAAAIRSAKAQASEGARMMPAYVHQRLQPFFAEDILQSVRYNTFDSTRIALDSATMMLNNDAGAITLDDVVVFRDESKAQDSILWAHELAHVLQYRDRGIDTFANTYTTNAWVLENEARDVEARVARGLAGVPGDIQTYAYFDVNGLYLYGDSAYNLYPADPVTGNVVGPPNGRVYFQDGRYWAVDSYGNVYPASRVR